MATDPAAPQAAAPSQPSSPDTGLPSANPGPESLLIESPQRRIWRYVRALLAPVMIWLIIVLGGLATMRTWRQGQGSYDEGALREWLDEARFPNQTLADLAEDYMLTTKRYVSRWKEEAVQPHAPGQRPLSKAFNEFRRLSARRVEISEHLRAMGEPPTKLFPGQLPLFPIIYRLQVEFDFHDTPEAYEIGLDEMGRDTITLAKPIIWDSGLISEGQSAQQSEFQIHPHVRVHVRYQLHAFDKRHQVEQETARQKLMQYWLVVGATALGLIWLFLVQSREREQERQRLLTRQRVEHAERLRAEAERELLQQRLAAQAAERQALELKSHLYASIGVMAGSYAHNIKNLLVRPNDLLRRCLEGGTLPKDEERNLVEVRQILGEVTERLQQILNTVQRDPAHSQLEVLDLGQVLRQLARTWVSTARDRWQLDLQLELPAGGEGELLIRGDASHLQQAVENLLFNARDATYEMRILRRNETLANQGLSLAQRQQGLIAANRWRGQVVLKARREPGETGHVVLEVTDNGIGMTEEVRRRCTETHFSTRRDKAEFQGHSTGMGLGLSFVVTILEHHGATLEIQSQPMQGAMFRITFQAVAR